MQMTENNTAYQPRILIVDDENNFRETLTDFLMDEGYQCDVAENARAATQLLQENQYDLLISDIKMPGNTNLELIQRVQEIAAGMPVILVTGHSTVQTAVEAFRLPVAAYIEKPLKFAELLIEVRKCVGLSVMHRTLRDTRQRLGDSCRKLEEMETLFSSRVDTATANSVDAFVELTLGNIVGSLSDLRSVTESLSHSGEGEGRPEVVAWTRLDGSRKALREAIDVLETTKHKFKSKQLGALRHKLQVAIDQLEEGTAWETDAS